MFNAALVGCGRMGICHARALKQLEVNLHGVADLNKDAAYEIVKSWDSGISPKVKSNLEGLLHQSVPDLLVIATTAQVHAAAAIMAMNAGINLILVEKPLATSLLECHKLLEISNQKGTRVAVNHQMRFLEQYTTPKAFLSSEAHGGFQSMHVAAGNFGLAMNGTHYIEAFRFLSDDSPAEVAAWFDSETLPNPRGPQFKDVSGCIRVTTTSGKRLYIDTSADQGHGVQVTYMSRNGRITIDELTGKMTTVVRQPEHREAPTNRYGMPVDIEEHNIKPVELIDSTKAVLEALIKGENYPTLQDATLAVKTLVAAYHSHRQGGVTVRLADIPDDDPEVFPWA